MKEALKHMRDNEILYVCLRALERTEYVVNFTWDGENRQWVIHSPDLTANITAKYNGRGVALVDGLVQLAGRVEINLESELGCPFDLKEKGCHAWECRYLPKQCEAKDRNVKKIAGILARNYGYENSLRMAEQINEYYEKEKGK